MSSNSVVDCLSPSEITKVAENIGYYKVKKHPLSTLFSAIIAGIFISIAFVFYITVTTGAESVAYGLAKLVGGICFSMGLMLVVVCGADLFTSTILTIVAKATKRITWLEMLKNWLLVYIGNFIGASILVTLMWLASQHMVNHGSWGINVLKISTAKINHSFIEAVALGVLANIMVCLAAWMSYAGRSLTDKILVMILPVAMFVACGFEHSIANMFMIPMGIVIKTFADIEFWHLLNLQPENYADLTVKNFVVNNLFPVTIGNIIGGLMIGLSYWGIHLRKQKEY